MLKHKRIREKGKTGLKAFFSELKSGDRVALIRNLSFAESFPYRFQGKTATVIGKQGKGIVVSVYDGNKEKKLVVQKIHLKKLSP